MESILSAELSEKSISSTIQSLKDCALPPSINEVFEIIIVKSSQSLTCSDFAKLFCVSAWIINKFKIKKLPDDWKELLDSILALSTRSSEETSDDEKFSISKEVHIIEKFIEQWRSVTIVDLTILDGWMTRWQELSRSCENRISRKV